MPHFSVNKGKTITEEGLRILCDTVWKVAKEQQRDVIFGIIEAECSNISAATAYGKAQLRFARNLIVKIKEEQ